MTRHWQLRGIHPPPNDTQFLCLPGAQYVTRAGAMNARFRWLEKKNLARVALFERTDAGWALRGIWDAPKPEPESFPSGPEHKPRWKPHKLRKTSVETECDDCGTPLAGNDLCSRCDEEAWEHEPERNTVECDDNCGALEYPTTSEEITAAYRHWKWHGSLHGCSHQE